MSEAVMNLAELTLERAQLLQGTEFSVELADGQRLSLNLEQAIPFETRQRRVIRGTPVAKREPFALYFVGPKTPLLTQGMYQMQSSTVSFEGLFIVPIGCDEHATEYEAVFT